MSLEDFLKKEKINNLYSYLETKGSNNTVEFGWVSAKSIDLDKPIVISYPSKSKYIEEEDKDWSKSEGKNATSLPDNEKYFSALTGYSASQFIDIWSDNIDSFSDIWREKNPNAREEEEEFLLDLARLIVSGKRFTKFGRVFKIVNVGLEK